MSKPTDPDTFGNEGAMFVRVRRLNLKGGHADWREYRERTGSLVKASASYDVVRAVRSDDKPRQKFLFGLGLLKEPAEPNDLVRFWALAVFRMQRHGLDDSQCRHLINAIVRKGAPKPSRSQCDEFAQRCFGWEKAGVEALLKFL